MKRIYIGEFISEKIVENFNGPKSYVQVYKVETKNKTDYIAITKDNQEHPLKQMSEDGFAMSIGENTYSIYPEDGDTSELL